MSIEQMKGKIDFMHEQISISRQCELPGLARSTLYYEPTEITPYNLLLMRKIDEPFLVTPFYGSRRMAAWLQREGYDVNRKRIKRLMQLMGIQAIFSGPNLSKVNHEHKIYPYLLRNLDIRRANQVCNAEESIMPSIY